MTTLRVGGPARWFQRATCMADVTEAHRRSTDEDAPLFVMGGGSNVVVSDDGWHGLVLRVEIPGIDVADSGDGADVTAGAGESWDRLVEASVARGLRGLECLSGIPGSVGGTPIQNVGAYGQEVGEVVTAVHAFDRRAGEPVTLSGQDCRFAYRQSRFKQDDRDRFVVCGVTLRLTNEQPVVEYPDIRAWLERERISSPAVADVRRAVITVRRGKGMVLDEQDADTRSVGSFFMNPVVMAAVREGVSSRAGRPAPCYAMPGGMVKIPAAWLIEQAGFRKGDVDGRVGISGKHTLALVNRGGATAADVVRYAVKIKRQVLDRFGVALYPEPVFVGFGADAGVDYLRTSSGW